MKRKVELPKDFLDRLEFANLDPDEQESILKKAKEHVVEEQKRQAREAFLDEAIKVERRKHKPAEQIVDVLIDLPGHALRLLIDGVEYIHAFTYRVTAAQASSMYEQMQRCWNHENEVGGANRNFYQRPRSLQIGPQHLNVPNSRLLGV